MSLKILAHLVSRPLYVALIREDGEEVSAPEYARAELLSARGSVEGNTIVLTNGSELLYPEPKSDWGWVTGLMLCGLNNTFRVLTSTLTERKMVSADGEAPRFAIGSIIIKVEISPPAELSVPEGSLSTVRPKGQTH